ncbi:MAG TPA: TonB-dependent receptor [Terriglobia bacterium]|nr:TonB-dependent receptor [Terriglobia bacterium]
MLMWLRRREWSTRRLAARCQRALLTAVFFIPTVPVAPAFETRKLKTGIPQADVPRAGTNFDFRIASFTLPAGNPQTTAGGEKHELRITVVDENGVAVPSARITLTAKEAQTQPAKGETDYAGGYEFTGLDPGVYELRVEKEGFYAVTQNELRVGETQATDVTLSHEREYYEAVNVVASPATIDPQKTESSHSLESRQIIDLPFAVPRDIRYALPLLPGVLQDSTGQLHVDGSSTRQVQDVLDGFNLSDPATGLFDARVNVEALRSVDVASSRYPAQYGKASGGILSMDTGMGDDHLRFSASDFVPSVVSRKGLHISGWTPRGAFSGPLAHGRAWFLLAPEGEYDLNLVNELPPGANRNSVWRFENLAKAQVNVTPHNILTTSLLLNRFQDHHAGLDALDPISTTVNLDDSADFVNVKDQALLSRGMLAEYGIAYSRFRTRERPMGDETYVMTPNGTSGNYFESAQGHSGRWQGIANLVLPSFPAWGRHEFKVGLDVDRVIYDQAYQRSAIQILREDGSRSRTASFPGSPSLSQSNSEYGAYAQDHWSISDRLLLDPGIRFDWDQITRGGLVSPRLAASFVPSRAGNTKIVAGAGVYYDASNLELYTRGREGQRVDTFYDSTGQVVTRPPVDSVFQVGPNLKQAWFLNWSAGVEHKLPTSIYLRAEFIEKRGHDGWTYINPCSGSQGCYTGLFTLENQRLDHYDAIEVTFRRTFRQNHVFFASYTRSRASSNAVLNFNILDPLFAPQAGGPLPWDSPNRLVTWGIVPLRKKVDLAYTADWRDGFPFSIVDQNQALVGAPDSRRFPGYFSLNLALERRIELFGFQWAVRAGFDDITNRHNPFAVDNNIDSPHFLQYSSVDGRALTGLIRLLGRK